MSSNASKQKATGTDSDNNSNSVSSEAEKDDVKQQHSPQKDSENSTPTNDPASTSATATSTSASVATAAAGHPPSQSRLTNLPPQVPRQRRAGFREQFLQKLRVMLDYESQNDSTLVHWSADGNSFIITDQNQFEADMIPTYFDNPIVFASFLSKLYRWGFSRLSGKGGRYEFRSPTFRRLGRNSEPAAAVAATVADTSSNAGGGASIQLQQQQQHQTQTSPLRQVMAQTNQPPAPNPLPRQADGSADPISNIQRSRQQPLSSQQSILNQHSNQPNIADAVNFLQGIVGNAISQNSLANQQPLLNQNANNHLLNINLTLPPLQPFQQWQHPNPTVNLLNNALNILVGNQTTSAPQMDYSPVTPQRDAIQALMNVYGMSSSSAGGAYPNTNTAPTISQPDNAIQSLLMLINQVCEDDRRRRAQADAVQSAIIASIVQILGVSNTIDEAESQRGLVAAPGQTLGSTGETTTPNVPLATHPTGMTVRVPHAAAAAGGQMQQGIPPSSAGNQNFQADSIATILQAARSAAGGQHEEDAETQIDEGKDDRPLSPRKRKSPDDGYGADDDDDDDHDSQRKK